MKEMIKEIMEWKMANKAGCKQRYKQMFRSVIRAFSVLANDNDNYKISEYNIKEWNNI